MTLRLAFLPLALLVAAPLFADTVLVNEDFESYSDSTELYAVWGPSNAAGELVDETFTEFITLDDLEPQAIGARAFPTGGQGVEHTGGSVLEYQLTLGEGSISPSETQSVVLQGDIFDIGGLGNKRLSIGLRNSAGNHIVELGHWNTSPVEFAGRAIIFPSPDNPNWVFYELPIELDRPDDADEITTLADIGEAWSTHRATITPTTITFEIDLFRDGLNAATGEAGWDATMTFDVDASAAGFDSLRIGGPSNSSSPGNLFYGGSIFDNIMLSLVDVDTGGLVGDYNGDGAVDGIDYALWRDTLGDSVTEGEGADGNNNGMIDSGDFTIWQDNYGAPVPAGAVATPEPATVLLSLLALVGFVNRRNR